MIFLASFVFYKKEAIVCELIPYSNFQEISSNVFVDASIQYSQQNNFSNVVDDAFLRVSGVYGNPISNPRIIATVDTKYAKYGFNTTGMQTPGFFNECIFLGPRGLNTDVLAHEIVHAEVRHRTSVFVELIELPVWFIEGTGIKVDYRSPFLVDNFDVSAEDVEKVKSLFFLRDFPSSKVKYYQASLVAIEPMNPKKLYKGLERLNNGEKFEKVFSELFQ